MKYVISGQFFHSLYFVIKIFLSTLILNIVFSLMLSQLRSIIKSLILTKMFFCSMNNLDNFISILELKKKDHVNSLPEELKKKDHVSGLPEELLKFIEVCKE